MKANILSTAIYVNMQIFKLNATNNNLTQKNLLNTILRDPSHRLENVVVVYFKGFKLSFVTTYYLFSQISRCSGMFFFQNVFCDHCSPPETQPYSESGKQNTFRRNPVETERLYPV